MKFRFVDRFSARVTFLSEGIGHEFDCGMKVGLNRGWGGILKMMSVADDKDEPLE